MVTVNTVDTTIKSAATTSDDSSAQKAIADFDTFLKLLTAQLKNQDPLNPQDGTEFTSQLAQFSSLEQQINTNTHLKNLIAAQPDTKQAEAMSYIGKEVLIPGGQFKLSETGNVEFSYDVDQKIKSATASIYNAAGEKVRTFNVDGAEGVHDVLWDGRNEDGERLPLGLYTVKVEGHGAVDAKGEIVDVQLDSYLYGQAEKVVKLGDDYAIGTADGRTVKLDKVLSARHVNSGTEGAGSTKHSTALQMLGKEILIPGTDFKYSGKDIGFTYGLTQDVQAVSITIKDSEGNKIKQVPFESSKGSHEYIWDGTNSDGDKVPEGKYTVEVKAQNIEEKEGEENKMVEQSLDTFYYGKASKVEAQNGSVVIYTEDGRKAFYENVISVKD